MPQYKECSVAIILRTLVYSDNPFNIDKSSMVTSVTAWFSIMFNFFTNQVVNIISRGVLLHERRMMWHHVLRTTCKQSWWPSESVGGPRHRSQCPSDPQEHWFRWQTAVVGHVWLGAIQASVQAPGVDSRTVPSARFLENYMQSSLTIKRKFVSFFAVFISIVLPLPYTSIGIYKL